MSTNAWLQYLSIKRDVERGLLNKGDLVIAKNKMKEDASNTRNIEIFREYWLLLGLRKGHEELVTEEKLNDRLARCKKSAKICEKRQKTFVSRPDMFRGCVVEWKPFMKYDERFWDYDTETYKAILPRRLSDKERSEFHKAFYQPYRLCEDGRDCSGTWQHTTSVYRCKDRTVVLLHKRCDC
jgi:hypothetical protein